MINNCWTDIPGFTVGHWTDLEAATGCTVLLCPQGATAGVDVRGTAPATRETDLLDPVCMVQQVHAILIGGGSAYGLAAADGVMRWLEERGYGFDVGVAKVPIVPAACLFDLTLGRSDVRPGADAGYAACEASAGGPVAVGNVGAGAGATVGKVLGSGRATKGGVGVASAAVTGDVVVSALVAVNAFGEIIDPAADSTVAGARNADGSYADTVATLTGLSAQASGGVRRTNTTLGIVATNVELTKAEATKVAQMAQDGLARTIRPAHAHFDGDALFALSHGDKQADLSLVGALAADVVAAAVLSAINAASPLHGIPAASSA